MYLISSIKKAIQQNYFYLFPTESYLDKIQSHQLHIKAAICSLSIVPDYVLLQDPSGTAKELGKVLEEAENDYQVIHCLEISIA